MLHVVLRRVVVIKCCVLTPTLWGYTLKWDASRSTTG